MMMNFEGKQLIDGQSIASGSEYFYAVNPASGENLDLRFFNASVEDINMAVAAAQRDFVITRQKTGRLKCCL